MISPTPTQQPQPPTSEETGKKVKPTTVRRRAGEAPAALFIKAIFRPIFKGLYYLLRAVGGHKLATLGVILLLLISISATSYFATGAWPFGIGSDPFHSFNVHGTGSSDHVKNWLYDLRDGNATAMSLIQSELIMSQPPDPNQLVGQYSEAKAHLSWKAINVVGTYTESDTTVENFVEVDLSANGPGGAVTGLMIWHFTTLQGRILFIDLVTFRNTLH